jgi:hypothetical protein
MSTHMVDSERLRCPLLRCGERFDGHEEMLRHLTQCQHFSTGEYVCYECMEVERFNDKKCTCCLGQPTKKRRIFSMAKHFFSNIGNAKVRRENHGPPDTQYNSSPIVDMYAQHRREPTGGAAQEEEGHGGGEQLELGQASQLELNGTALAELDSTPTTAELDTDHDTCPIPTQDHLAPYADTRDTLLSPVSDVGSQPRRPLASPITMQPNTGALSHGGRRPSLALNTRIDHYRTKAQTSYLSPRLSLRTSPHGVSPTTPWSASSQSSNIWSAGSNQNGMLASPITPLSAGAHSTTPQRHRIFDTEKDIDMLACPEDPHCYTPSNLPELSGDNQLPITIPRLLSDPLTFSHDPKDNYSWLSSIGSDLSFNTSVNMMFTDPNAKPAIPPDFLSPQFHGSSARTLVEQVWDALSAHFSNSALRLSRLQHNPLAASLRAQTPRTVASNGLTRFRRILEQDYSPPHEPLEYLCFIHLIYSFSLVLHEDNLATQSAELYEQAMAYNALLDIASRDQYCQVVSAIWHQNSQDLVLQGRFGDSTNRRTGNKGKEPDYHPGSITMANPDPLVIAGQRFLDELENIMINSNTQPSMEVLNSGLWSAHLTSNQSTLQPLAVASAYLVQDLCRRYHDSENLVQKLKVIGQNARAGYYTTIRKLELELIQTGKNNFTQSHFQNQYILYVRELCDQIYAQSGSHSRVEYYSFGISFIDSLIRNVTREPQQTQEGHPEYPLISYPYEDDFFRDLNKTLAWGYSMIPSTQQPLSPQGVPDFGSTLDLTPLHPVPSEIHPATGSPNTLPITSDASETHSDSYAVSPAPLSDTPMEPSVSGSYRPTPPLQAQGKEGEPSSTSTLASSGQKVEANERCELCGYRPKGDPQWFKGSMAKHKKMQHSNNPPTIYKCPFPGCNSEYKNRKDNLRQHQIEKNHFVGDEATQQRNPKRKRG